MVLDFLVRCFRLARMRRTSAPPRRLGSPSKKGLAAWLSYCVLGLMLWRMGAADADGLGKLLTTPSERQLIEASRRLEQTGGTMGEKNGAIRFEGVARDEEGALKVWVNGSAFSTPEALRRSGMALVAGDGTEARLVVHTMEGKTVQLLPGQIYDPASAAVLDTWEQGAGTGAEETKGEENRMGPGEETPEGTPSAGTGAAPIAGDKEKGFHES